MLVCFWPFVLVPGQEDPRTSIRGHTLELNLKEPIRSPTQYLLYHRVFEAVRAQGGLIGYAHVNENQDILNATRGLALDVPFGLVDFVEVMSLFSGVSTWFDFLNLGYKLSPSAGTDYPWGDVPGTVRNYVKIPAPFSSQAWFEGLKGGHTFVTSGPMLEISINGYGMGSEIRVRSAERLIVTAQASMNPDIGALVSLDLIEQGETVKVSASEAGAPRLTLRQEMTAQHSRWFVLRARGKNENTVALSAPIYVVVEGKSFWKPDAVPGIVARQKQKMRELLGLYQKELCCEGYETHQIDEEQWDAQQDALQERIRRADALYDELLKRSAEASVRPSVSTNPE